MKSRWYHCVGVMITRRLVLVLSKSNVRNKSYGYICVKWLSFIGVFSCLFSYWHFSRGLGLGLGLG